MVSSKYVNLAALLEEEADAVDAEKDIPKSDMVDSAKLRSAARKIRRGELSLTKAELTAVRDALGDLGDLYREDGYEIVEVPPIPMTSEEIRLISPKLGELN